MGDVFGKGGSESTSTSSLDPVQKQMLTDVYGRAVKAVDRPYQAYGGSTLAGFTPTQLQAQDIATQGALGNVGGQTLTQAVGGTQNVMGYNPMQVQTGSALDNLGAYMNPYLQNVAGGVLSNLDRSRQLAQQGTAAQAAAAGAYGGSRHGVADAETNRNFFDVAGNQLNQLFSQGYGAATNLATSDLARQLQAQQSNQAAGLSGAQLNLGAANQLAGLSDQQRQQYFGNAAMLEGVGGQQQAMEQAQLDDAYQRWLEAQNYEKSNVGFLSNIVNGMPSFGGTTAGSTQQTAGIGDVLGTVGTMMSFFSDENIKSGRRPASPDAALKAIEGTDVEMWRYDPAKGGPDDGGREHIGPMAQSVAKNLGIGDGRSIPVVDMMGTQMAATKALAKKVKRLEKKGKK
jgi:hypothetical protein